MSRAALGHSAAGQIAGGAAVAAASAPPALGGALRFLLASDGGAYSLEPTPEAAAPLYAISAITEPCLNGTDSLEASLPCNGTLVGGGDGSDGSEREMGLLTVFISVSIILCVVAVFLLIHRHLLRERRRVAHAVQDSLGAELPALEAADLEAARRWHTASARISQQREAEVAAGAAAATGQQHGAQRPVVVVIQPDLGIELCVKDGAVDGNGSGRHSGEKKGSSSGEAPTGADVDSDSVSAAGGTNRRRSASGGVANAAVAAPVPPQPPPLPTVLPRLPVTVQRLAIDFPTLGTTVLLLLPPPADWPTWLPEGLGGGSGGGGLPQAHSPPPMSSVEVGPVEEGQEEEEAVGAQEQGLGEPQRQPADEAQAPNS